MTITPYAQRVETSFEEIRKNDSFFNAEAAQKAFDLVMKMDDDEAKAFVHLVVSDVVEETIEKNLRTLQGHLDRVVEKRIQKVKAAVARSAVSKSAEAIPYAQALALIEKARKNPYLSGAYVFNEKDFNRDPSTGQFRTKIRHTQQKEIHHKTARTLGIPEHDNKGLTAKERAQFQDEYLQLSRFLGAVHQSSRNPADTKILLHVQNKATGQEHYIDNHGTKPNKDAWDPKTERLVGVSARPDGLNVGGAAFGLQNSLSSHDIHNINQLDGRIDSFSSDWTGVQDGDEMNSNARLYRRLAAGSGLVSELAPPGSKVQIAAEFGRFVGSHGHQAEAVIGPTARKTAYRYRGTERAPDPKLVAAYAQAINRERSLPDEAMERRVKIAQNRALKQAIENKAMEEQRKGKRVDVNAIRLPATERARIMNQAAKEVRGRVESGTPTWEQREPGRAEIVSYLRQQIPKKGLSDLQLKAGNTPPSEGVMLNSKGQIVAQAVGYSDDHYLPFNLKNLKGLKGGEYIRTRSFGGPTSEDIYTGLMSGARQVTVVSHSGVFTVKFKDDFRGGRRHNDKARRMTRKYEQILDTVQSREANRMAVPDSVKDELLNDVRAKNPFGTEEEIDAAYKKRMHEFTSSPELSVADRQMMRRMYEAGMNSNPSRDAIAYRKQIRSDLMRAKQFNFQLNGIGYEAGLEALQEQFPYYIEVSSTPEDEDDAINFGLDRGYVEPGRNRPTQALHGLYGTSIHPGVKRKGLAAASASNANYQGARLKPVSVPSEKVEQNAGEADEGGEKKADTPKAKGPSEKAQTALAEAKEQVAAYDIAQAMKRTLNIEGEVPKEYGFMNMSPDEFADYYKKNRKDFDANIARMETDKQDYGAAVNQAISRYRAAGREKEQVGRIGDDALIRGGIKFADPGFNKGASEADQRRVLAGLSATRSMKYDKPVTEMSPEEVKDEIKGITAYLQAERSMPGLDAETRRYFQQNLMEGYTGNGNTPQKQLEVLRRMEAMQTVHPETTKNFNTEMASNPRILADMNQSSRTEHIRQQVAALNILAKNQGEKTNPDVYHLINTGQAMVDDPSGFDEAEIEQFIQEANHAFPDDLGDLTPQQKNLYLHSNLGNREGASRFKKGPMGKISYLGDS